MVSRDERLLLATPDECEMIARVSGDELPGDEATATGFAGDSSLIDPVDRIRGLAHMDVLIDMANRSRAGRLRRVGPGPRTSSERHWQEFGHALGFGCCAPDREPTGGVTA